MSARLLEGAPIAREIGAALREEIRRLAVRDVRPGLGVLLVGDDPASALYVRSKARACGEQGLHHEIARLEASATTEAVAEHVVAYNRRRDIHGILVQLPLPPQVNTAEILRLVDPAKDVDGFHPENVGLLVQKRPRFVPCTPAGIMELLVRQGVPLAGQRAVVLGRSDIVGKPMASLLLHADATVTVCHSKTRELASVTSQADVLVAAIGRVGFVRAEHVKAGAVVVDVGINRVEDAARAAELVEPARMAAFARKGFAVVGDVHYSAASRAGALTPVPGGVGPLTIALLIKNTVKAASMQNPEA